MASSSSSLHLSGFLLILISLWVSLISPVVSQTCSSQKFASNETYAHCLDLPALTSYLHFSYNSSNSTLSVAFLASPPKPAGWVCWAINPKAKSMIGAQALIGYKDSKGVMTVKTYNISGYSPDTIIQSKLAFYVWDARAEETNGVMRIFAKVKVPASLATNGTLNHVWQVGPSMSASEGPSAHAMGMANMKSVGSLDLKSGNQTTGSGGAAGAGKEEEGDEEGIGPKIRNKNIHGVLNAVSWGFLFPAGIVFARHMRTFESMDPAWFYLHVSCQVSAYAIGLAGWASGIKLGNDSQDITFSTHRNIGITLFVLATIQIFALFLRPKKDHKYRIYWNFYHHGVGYTILILGLVNVFKGLDILLPEEKYRSAYISVLAVLAGIAVFLEVITWIVVIKRKSRQPYNRYNGHGIQETSNE